MSTKTRYLTILVPLLSLSLALATLPLASASAMPRNWTGHAHFVHTTDDTTADPEEPAESEPAPEPAPDSAQPDPPIVTEPDPPPPADEPMVDPAPAPVADVPAEVPADPVPAESDVTDASEDAPETAESDPASEPSDTFAAASTDQTDEGASTEDTNQPDDSGDFTAAAAPATVDDFATTHQGEAIQIRLLDNDTDADGDNLDLGSVSGNIGGSVSINSFGDGIVTYTPGAGFVGTDTFTYTVSDGAQTATATVTITVTAVNAPPVANDDTATTTAGVPIDIDVLANDTDPDGDALILIDVGFADSGATVVLDPSAGLIRYTPEPGFVGTDQFDYEIDDGDLSDIAIVTVTVLPAQTNLPPVAVDDSYTTSQDTPLAVPSPGIFANDSDPNGDDFSISSANVVPTASHGSLTVSSGDGAFLYTLDPGFAGADSFQYQLTDGQALGNVATVTITVEPAAAENQPPVAVDDTATTTEGVPVTINVLANDSDPDGDELLLDFVDDAVNGTAVVLDPIAGTLTYTPNLGFVGTDAFFYEIRDGDLSTSGLVTVTVTAAPTAPDPDPEPPVDAPKEPKNEEPAPKQPAAKPAPKPTAVATTLPDTGVGPSTAHEDGHALLLGLLLVLFGALVALRRRLA
ncbi:MAG: Ig-like domain-containing protein [Thermomicrobiales bacterium]